MADPTKSEEANPNGVDSFAGLADQLQGSDRLGLALVREEQHAPARPGGVLVGQRGVRHLILDRELGLLLCRATIRGIGRLRHRWWPPRRRIARKPAHGLS